LLAETARRDPVTGRAGKRSMAFVHGAFCLILLSNGKHNKSQNRRAKAKARQIGIILPSPRGSCFRFHCKAAYNLLAFRIAVPSPTSYPSPDYAARRMSYSPSLNFSRIASQSSFRDRIVEGFHIGHVNLPPKNGQSLTKAQMVSQLHYLHFVDKIAR
jgi:hypothetical protein